MKRSLLQDVHQVLAHETVGDVLADVLAAGTFAVGEAFPWIRGFYESGFMGRLTLPQAFHLPYGLVVLLVVLMALGGFAGAAWVERRFATPARKD